MGRSTQWLWYSVYARSVFSFVFNEANNLKLASWICRLFACSKQVSWRTRFLVVGDWSRRFVFGRDSSRIWVLRNTLFVNTFGYWSPLFFVLYRSRFCISNPQYNFQDLPVAYKNLSLFFIPLASLVYSLLNYSMVSSLFFFRSNKNETSHIIEGISRNYLNENKFLKTFTKESSCFINKTVIGVFLKYITAISKLAFIIIFLKKPSFSNNFH